MSIDTRRGQGANPRQGGGVATAQGVDASGLTDDEIIPATGLLDSMAILELLVWYEENTSCR